MSKAWVTAASRLTALVVVTALAALPAAAQNQAASKAGTASKAAGPRTPGRSRSAGDVVRRFSTGHPDAAVRTPLFAIFERGLLANTLNACWWTVSGATVAYSLNLFATHLQVDLHLSPALVATPIMLGNLTFFLACCGWGWVADQIGRRWTLIIVAAVAIPLTPMYLLTDNYALIVTGMLLQGFFAGGGMNSQNASYMTERFPTEVRATASGFCYQVGIGIAGLVAPLITYIATTGHAGFAVPMLIAGVLGCVSFIFAVYFGPETKGKVLSAELEVG